ncbi:MAG TPA: hypothetical protein VGB51_07730 [Actinomycetota bacterium]
MKKLVISALAVLLLGTVGVPAGQATHNADVHSENVELVGNFNDGGEYRQGSDIAFWGDYVILGNYNTPGGFRIVDTESLTEVGQFECPGTQADVSVWKHLVFVSVDGPRSGPECGAPSATNDQVAAGTAWEGLRIVSIKDPAHPVQIQTVATDCGSHTHTLLPDVKRKKHKRLWVYIGSYPLTGHYAENEAGTECNQHGIISVIKVPLKHPRKAKVVTEPAVGPAVGCHDITVLPALKLAAAACITETQMWDISKPANPVILSHIEEDQIQIHHSTGFSNDGTTVVISDELGGAEATPGCTGGNAPIGAMWFYDVTDPEAPVQKSFWRIPRIETSALCTAHDFNVVPMRTDQDVLVSAWYNGGTTIVDFTDPAAPTEIGFYNAKEEIITDAWASYFYQGRIYVNNFDEDLTTSSMSRGMDVLEITDASLVDAVSLKRLNVATQEFFYAG